MYAAKLPFHTSQKMYAPFVAGRLREVAAPFTRN